VCDGVFIGNNANVLGNITVGENSRVGAGSVVLSDVPPNSTVSAFGAHYLSQWGAGVDYRSARGERPALGCADRLSARVEELESRLGGEPSRPIPLRPRRPSGGLSGGVGAPAEVRIDGRGNLKTGFEIRLRRRKEKQIRKNLQELLIAL